MQDKTEISSTSQIKTFIKCADDLLENYKHLIYKENSSFEFKFEIDRMIKIENVRINEKELNSFLLNFRTFYMRNSDSNLLKILKIILDLDLNKDERDAVEKTKKRWEDILKTSEFSFKRDNTEYTPKQIFDIILNNKFHPENGDLGLKKLTGNKGTFLNEAVMFTFENLLLDLSHIVITTSNFLKERVSH